MFRQGDVLIERTNHVPDGQPVEARDDGGILLAEGELTGHHHSVYGKGVVMYRDDALARDIGPIYIGSLSVPATGAEVKHQEHASVSLPGGHYTVTRQREFNAGEEAVHPD